MSENDGKERIAVMLLSPFWIFYYYLYSNYLRMGRNERYAISTTPAAASVFFVIGPCIWFIKPVRIICGFIEARNGYVGRDMSELFFLIFLFISFMGMSSYLSKKGRLIVANFKNVKVPSLEIIFLVEFLYCLPFFLSILTIEKWFIESTIFIFIYQMAIYVMYFSKIMRIAKINT